ncbi:histidine phosphatase [Klebsormidium nitens]|uniref:Histidine phosphatase n=1 Tax=Klebsormidium nitens TaxID=105231 RepID=A0A1Y1ILS9_KLENI|nr:histidine phosphatase [Klebsormidium nitens]|eukprot:GAQ90101.1 histidine phosphatase [Klebsormidium nitens]
MQEALVREESLVSSSSEVRRSQLLRALLLGAGACAAGEWEESAAATGLILLPPAKLTNEYFLVRAGESEVETQGFIMTNPVAKTSMDSGLSKLGRQQVLSTIQQLQDLGACTANCWIWPSITQRAYQTAELVASAFTVGRSRIVPEYSFLDARGLGSYEGRSLAQIQEVYESDRESAFYRPPAFVDGTPNESVNDVLVRVRQLMSILETQYQGDQVVIVSPDSDNLSVLQAALLGLDLRQHSSLAFRPGEVRKVVLSGEAPPRPTSGFFKCKQLRNRQWDCTV